MKKMMYAVLFLFAVVNGHAQSVDFKKETALVDKKPYCLLEKSGDIASPPTYTVKNLDGKPLMIFKTIIVPTASEFGGAYLDVTVVHNEEKFQVEQGFNTRKKIIKDLYTHEVLVDGAINEAGLKQYKLTFAGDFEAKYNAMAAANLPQAASATNNETQYVIVKRNTTANLYVINGNIKQDNVLIATYKVSEKLDKGNAFENIEIYNSANQLVARANNQKFGKTLQFTTAKDNQAHELKGREMVTTQNVESITRFLIDRLYL
jgi:hypothetical protein